MPYVPQDDRAQLDPIIEDVAHAIAEQTSNNSELLPAYKHAFFRTIEGLLHAKRLTSVSYLRAPYCTLGQTIHTLAIEHGYDGAYLGELNYSITRIIQRVPQIMVKTKKWKKGDELRYWVYARTVEALIWASKETLCFETGIAGVFEDIKDEYKRRVNTAYEAAQIIKNGDCYDAPYYTRLMPIVDEEANTIGHIEVMLKRDPDTERVDVLNGSIVMLQDWEEKDPLH